MVAVAAVDRERARAPAEPFGARAYADHGEPLARERPDAVSVCAPAYRHDRQALDALAAGAAVLTEKPFARSAGWRGSRLPARPEQRPQIVAGRSRSPASRRSTPRAVLSGSDRCAGG